MSESRRYHIWSNSGGCPQNQLDAARVATYLEAHGFAYEPDPSAADLILVNGCAYRGSKEDESLERLRAITRWAKPGARVVLGGCVPRIAPKKVAPWRGRVPIIPASELREIVNVVGGTADEWEASRTNRIPDHCFRYAKPFRRRLARTIGALRRHTPRGLRHHADRLLMYDHSPDSFVVRVAEGCLGSCTYCAIRRSRGRLRSRPLDRLVDEVRRGVAEGADEILLTATELAAYGRDIGSDLSELLEQILDVPGDFDLLLFYANPRWLIDIWPRLEPIFATGRIHFLHLSLNGGSDRVLERMRRGYTLEAFESLIDAIRPVSPGTVLQTQVIVGFPGERELDFAATRAFFARRFFENVQVHDFDPRPGTRAAVSSEQVPHAERMRRRRVLYRQTLLAKLRHNATYPFTWRRKTSGARA